MSNLLSTLIIFSIQCILASLSHFSYFLRAIFLESAYFRLALAKRRRKLLLELHLSPLSYVQTGYH